MLPIEVIDLNRINFSLFRVSKNNKLKLGPTVVVKLNQLKFY